MQGSAYRGENLFPYVYFHNNTYRVYNLPPPSVEGLGDAILALFAAGGPSTLSSWSAMMSRIKSQRLKTFNRHYSEYFQVYLRSRMKIFKFCKYINPVCCNICHAAVFYPHNYSLEFQFRFAMIVHHKKLTNLSNIKPHMLFRNE